MTTKTLKLIIALLLALFAVYIFFFPPTSAGIDKPELPVVENDSIETLVDTNSVCLNFEKYQPSTLQTGLISDMVNIYRVHQGKAINNSMPDPDAESVWFNLDSIKKFIYHVEKLSSKNSVESNKLGLRFYYASYPDRSFWGNSGYKDLQDFKTDTTKNKYQYKHTIVMIPTLDINGVNSDFNPLDKATYTSGLPKRKSEFNGRPTTNTTSGQVNIMGLASTNSETNSTGGEKGTGAKNHGSLAPPDATMGIAF